MITKRKGMRFSLRRMKMYKILVCDDEKDIVSALRIYLTAEGYEVFEAFHGK